MRNVVSYFFTVLILSCTMNAQAQDPAFEEWKSREKTAFDDFRTAEDIKFIAFLEAEWQEFQIFQGGVRDLTPKPAKPAVVRNLLAGEVKDDKTTQITNRRGEVQRSPKDFYGHKLSPLSFPASQLRALDKPQKTAIAEAWSDLSAVDHRPVVQALKSYQQSLGLGDWGVIQLVNHLLKDQFGDANSRNAYSWFLLNKLGYNVKLGYTRDSLVLLLPTKNKTYGMDYTTIDGQVYYLAARPTSGKLMSYDGHYKAQQLPFDFSLTTLIKPTPLFVERELSYTLAGSRFDFKLQFDAGLSDFLWEYPQLDLAGYFQTPPANPVLSSLQDQLRPLIKELTPRDSINFLLRFVQVVFRYQTDTVQFGREKYMVVEESLYYGINDCEDRSIFLAWLIDSLLGLEVVALDYPGHVALGVRTAIRSADDFIEENGRKYLVVDPTYIGADAGMAIPAFKHEHPKIVPASYPK